jgi:hypothetical protein
MKVTDVGSLGWAPIVVDLDESRVALMVTQCYRRSGAKQEAFATLMGVGRTTLCQWLAGSSPVPKWAARAALFAAVASGVPISFPKPSQNLFERRKPISGR